MTDSTRRDLLTLTASAGLALAAQNALSQEKKAEAPAAAKPAGKAAFREYAPQTFKTDGLKGLEKEMLEQHLALYRGYVTNTNKANAWLAQMLADGKADGYDFAEVRRRLGFEYSGMRLHEVYFGQLVPEGTPVDEKWKAAVSATWGSWEAWVADVTRTALMRGIGWAVTFRDPLGGGLQNFWLSDHENAVPAGLVPVFALDVWEHAYVKQYGAGGRKAYVEAYLGNVDWGVVGKRL